MLDFTFKCACLVCCPPPPLKYHRCKKIFFFNYGTTDPFCLCRGCTGSLPKMKATATKVTCFFFLRKERKEATEAWQTKDAVSFTFSNFPHLLKTKTGRRRKKEDWLLIILVPLFKYLKILRTWMRGKCNIDFNLIKTLKFLMQIILVYVFFFYYVHYPVAIIYWC